MSWEDRIIEKVDIERWRNRGNTVEARATRLYNRRIRALLNYHEAVGVHDTLIVNSIDDIRNKDLKKLYAECINKMQRDKEALYKRCLEEVQRNESNIK